MNKTMFFLNKKHNKKIFDFFIKEYNLQLCFKSKKEIILKNNDLLISFKKNYFTVLIYDSENENLIYNVKNIDNLKMV